MTIHASNRLRRCSKRMKADNCASGLRNSPSPSDAPPVGPLLAELHGVGLVTQETTGAGRNDTGDGAEYGFHELVRERVAVWMADHADQRDPRPDDAIREGVR